jgi:anti-sigma regulatory factor (Ser/Thr protein kinase)
MKNRTTTRVPVNSETDITRAVVETNRAARAQGFPQHDVQKAATAVSELARNIIKYAGSGEILIGGCGAEGKDGLEVTARDRGPGIEDVDEALRDHFSSGGTLGLGLPGVRRMMDEFEIDSAPGKGTRVTIRLWRQVERPRLAQSLRKTAERNATRKTLGRGWGGVLSDERDEAARDVGCAFFIRPCLGERVSGDTVLVDRREDLVFVGLVDALGHGAAAHETASVARRYLREAWGADPVTTMQGLHHRLAGSVGAAAGLGVLDVAGRILRYVGVGNTVIRTLGPRGVRLHSTEGTLGAHMRTPQERRLQLHGTDIVVLYTDGVSDRFDLDDYPQARYEPVQTIARVVVERFGKSHDDGTCVALRYFE